MSDFWFVTSDDRRQIELGRALRVQNAAEIRAHLLTLIEEQDRVMVKLNGDAEVDISFLQLLCSAHRTAALLKKTFGLHPMRSSGVDRSLEVGGYLHIRGCTCDARGTCIWRKGENDG